MNVVKDPNDYIDVAIDWSDWLDGDTIADSVWSAPAGITASGETNTSTLATVWLTGGTGGVDYLIRNRITTDVGRVADRSVVVRVRER